MTKNDAMRTLQSGLIIIQLEAYHTQVKMHQLLCISYNFSYYANCIDLVLFSVGECIDEIKR
jgi:hypothetical protein